MKRRCLIAAGLLSAFITLPAVAGPNWDVIHEAESYASSHTNKASNTSNPGHHAGTIGNHSSPSHTQKSHSTTHTTAQQIVKS
ncbi:MAG: hypothetical protein R8K48_06555 [Gallionella sp.]